jgi:hypothetical protein
MIEQLISFETAKLAKERGFTCNSEYFWKEGFSFNKKDYNPITYQNLDNIPTQSLLQKYLREIHKIDISIFQSGLFNRCWFFNIYSKESRFAADLTQDSGNNYEQALEKALVVGLNLIKKKE